MELAWVRYQFEAKHKYLLMLLLGEHDGKLVGVESNSLSNGEAAILRKFMDQVDKLDVEGKVTWIKRTLPSLVPKLRTVRTDRSHIVSRYKVSGIGAEKAGPGPAP